MEPLPPTLEFSLGSTPVATFILAPPPILESDLSSVTNLFTEVSSRDETGSSNVATNNQTSVLPELPLNLEQSLPQTPLPLVVPDTSAPLESFPVTLNALPPLESRPVSPVLKEGLVPKPPLESILIAKPSAGVYVKEERTEEVTETVSETFLSYQYFDPLGRPQTRSLVIIIFTYFICTYVRPLVSPHFSKSKQIFTACVGWPRGSLTTPCIVDPPGPTIIGGR